MAKRKRKATKKQLAALARGRATMKAKRRAKAQRKKRPRRAVASAPVQRRSRKKSTPKKTRRTTMAKRKAPKRRRKAPARRRSGGGRRGGLLSGIEWKDMAGAAAYGWAEGKDGGALLKKVPVPEFVGGIGYAGVVGLLAHFAGKNVGGTAGKVLRHVSKGTLDVAAYKLAKNGGLFATVDASLAGDEVGYGADGMEGVEVGFTTDPDEVSGDEDGNEVGYGADGAGY
jgi:hypothetical protein